MSRFSPFPEYGDLVIMTLVDDSQVIIGIVEDLTPTYIQLSFPHHLVLYKNDCDDSEDEVGISAYEFLPCLDQIKDQDMHIFVMMTAISTITFPNKHVERNFGLRISFLVDEMKRQEKEDVESEEDDEDDEDDYQNNMIH